MIFSCTKKVLDKLKKYKAVENAKEEVGRYNWYVDLINLDRKNYFLFTHSETLFSFFVYAGTKKQLENIELIFAQRLQEQIIRDIGTLDIYLENLFPPKDNHRFIKTNNRSIVGSMVDFKNQLYAHNYGPGNIIEKYDLLNQMLNKIPMSYLKYKYPKVSMKEMLEAIVEEK